MPDSKEILDDIEKFILESKEGEILDIEIFGKKAQLIMEG